MESTVATHRLGTLGKELIICLIHGNKVIHGGDKHINLDHIRQAAASLFQHGRQVLEGLSLCAAEMSAPTP